MEFLKKYWFYVLAAILLVGVFYHIESLPNGVISKAPPLTGQYSHYSSTDNVPVAPKPQEEQAGNNKTIRADGNIKEVVIQSAPGQPSVQVTVKSTKSGPAGDENTLVDNDPWHKLANGIMGFMQFLFVTIIMFMVMSFAFRWFMNRGMPGSGPAGGGGGMNRGLRGQGGGAAGQDVADKVLGQWIHPEDIEINGFSDVAGIPEAISQVKKVKRQIRETVRVFEAACKEEEDKLKADGKDPKTLVKSTVKWVKTKKKFGGMVPNCILLEGPPGTGKTLLVTALAKEAGVDIFVISGSDFVEMFVGLGAARVREMFYEGRQKKPCIIFIDELDAVGRARTSGPASHPEADQTLNAMLVETQGLNTGKSNEGLWIFAATNRADILDPALLRPGRFTWKIKVDPPNIDGRVAIIGVHVKKREMPLSPDVNIRSVSTVLTGLTGADLANVVNETALYAEEVAELQAEKLREAKVSEAEIEKRVKSTVCQEDFFEGLLRHLMGLKKEVTLTFDELFNTVVHEAGHGWAIAHEYVAGHSNHRVRFIAVEPRGRAGGLTFFTPDRDMFGKTLDEVDAESICGFGGSAAQMVFLNRKDSGPDNDFERVAEQIHMAIGRWYGSEKLGPISLGQRGFTSVTEMGAKQKDRIDQECNLKTKVLYAKTWWIMNLFIRSEHSWTMFWELLEKKVMREERFYELFDAMMKDLEAHPEWKLGALESLVATVEKNPDDWSPAAMDAPTRAFVEGRVEALRVKYEALCAAETAA